MLSTSKTTSGILDPVLVKILTAEDHQDNCGQEHMMYKRGAQRDVLVKSEDEKARGNLNAAFAYLVEGYRGDGSDFPEVRGKCSSTSVLRWQDRSQQTQAATKKIPIRHYQKN